MKLMKVLCHISRNKDVYGRVYTLRVIVVEQMKIMKF